MEPISFLFLFGLTRGIVVRIWKPMAKPPEINREKMKLHPIIGYDR
jgi:hypothetical protein